MSHSEIQSEVEQAHSVFADVFGFKARSVAAPGWHSTPTSLRVFESYNLLYTSNTRNGPPHFPNAGGTTFKTLEIPTTLPTLDEVLAAPGYQDQAVLLKYYRDAIHNTEIHTIHTEVEGMAYLPFFEEQLEAWKSDGAHFVTLADLANEFLSNSSAVPVRLQNRVTIANRGGLVSSSAPIADEASVSC